MQRNTANKKDEYSFEWEATFNSITDFVSIHDKDFRIIRVNKALLDLLGLKNDEIIGRKCYEVIHGMDSPLPDCPHERTINTAGPHIIEFYEPRLGLFLHVSTSPLFDKNGEMIGSVHIARDISERKRAEEELRKTLDKLRDIESIINQSPAMVFLWPIKEGWPVEFVSENVKDFLGYSAEEFMSGSVSWPGITHREDVPRLEAEIKGYLEDGKEEFNQEYRLITKSGDVRWMSDRNRFRRDSSGSATHIQSIVIDVTERRKTEEELKKAKDELQTKVKERTAELELAVELLQEEISERTKIEVELLEAQKKLKTRADELSESNVALKVLLNQRENDQKEFANNILSNVKHLVMPYLTKLKRNRPSSEELTYLNILESNLNEIVSPFSQTLSSKYLNFTPKEIQIADLIKDGKQDKEIMEILNISLDTVKTHRRNIRKKLGITNARINLRTKLLSIN